ncbi:MAG: hypothetical protein CVV30_11400 [Methanomicrobiales archaeon HGW-Methanomicrobiales-1]|jgi:hypothetical protein|nr:MAG: hypothetical protein CVV30_11400 [Methanomicrobiales archaeon HGW-Methanomicrobiales-1]
MACDNSPSDGDKKTEDAPISVIKMVFDQFAITHIFKNIINKTSWKATDQLNDAIVLLIFLFVLFYGSQQIKLELSLAVVTLVILLIFVIVEFVGANSPYFSRLFFSEEKAEHFIKNLESYKTPDVERNLTLLTFSPKNINSLLSVIQSNKNKIHPYIIDEILLYNPLSTENLDRVFSKEILRSNLRRDLIIDLLMKYKNQLSPENIENIFTFFENDEQLLKTLIATQIDSDSLITTHPNCPILEESFEKYHKNAKTKSRIFTLIKRTQTNVITYRLLFVLPFWPVFWFCLLLLLDNYHFINNLNIVTISLFLFFISGLFAVYVIKPVVNKIVNYWIDTSKSIFFELL